MRSNRTLTQFIVNKIESFLEHGKSNFLPETAGNTTISLTTSGDIDVLSILLFNKEIAKLSFDGSLFLAIELFDGGFYDKNGCPSRTTRERQNGILDLLGEEVLIPEGVRVFIDPSDNGCYVGKKQQRRRIGKGFSSVTLQPHHCEVSFYG